MADGSVVIEIKGESDGFENELEKVARTAEGKTGKAVGKLGTVAKMASAAAVAGAAAAGAALVGLGKSAIESYAQYEQLVGGIDTLFGTASGAVQRYAENAYKTAGMSANQYMETATAFSASLVQSLGGDTAAAAEVANMAITDMSDNANKMGAAMSSIQDAYQGFAKQNYTMLDNLKLGYGGTQSEMQRLLADAEALTGIHYDIGNLNDVFSAIHVIQTELGITGTTAAEAMQTISGSVEMTKASWANLVTGIADDNADIDALVDNFVESATAAAENIIPRIGVVIKGIGELLVSLGAELIEGLASGIASALGTAADAVGGVMSAVFTAIAEFVADAIDKGAEIVSNLASGIAGAVGNAVSAISTVAQGIKNRLVQAANDALSRGKEIVGKVASGIRNGISTVTGAVQSVANTIKSKLVSLGSQALQWGRDIISNIANGIRAGISKVTSAVSSVAGAIRSFLHFSEPDKGPLSDFHTYMPDMMRLLADGIVDNVGVVTKAVYEAADGMAVAFEGVGVSVAAGFALGVRDSVGLAVDAVGGLSRAVSDRVKALNREIAEIEAEQDRRAKEKEIKDYEKNLAEKYEKLQEKEAELAKTAEAEKRDSLKKEIEKANQEVLDYKADWAEKQLKADEDAQKAAMKAQIDALEDYSDAFSDAMDDVAKSYESRVDTITDARDALAEKLAGTDLFKINEQGKAVFTNTKAEVAAIEKYGEAMTKLRNRGIDSGLYAEILKENMTDATKFANRLLKLSDKQWDEYIALYQRKQEVAQSVAEGIYSSDLEEAATQFMDSLPSEMEKAGKSAMDALGGGIAVEGQAAVQAMSAVTDRILQEIARINAGARLRAAVDANSAALSAGLSGRANASRDAMTAQNAANAANVAAAVGTVTAGNGGQGGIVVLNVNGKEFARATVGDFRAVEAQSPRIVSDSA